MSMPRKARPSNLVGPFSTNSSDEVGCAAIPNNVDRPDITKGVSNGDCSNYVGCKDDNGDVVFVSSLNSVKALGNMLFMIWVVRTAESVSIAQASQGI